MQSINEKVESALNAIYPPMRQELRREFTSEALKNPTFEPYVKANEHPFDLPYLPYRDSGNMILWASGGVIHGPMLIHRAVVIDTPDPKADFSVHPFPGHLHKVHLQIFADAEWRLFPGPIKIVIRHDESPETLDFLHLLIPELNNRGIQPAIEEGLSDL